MMDIKAIRLENLRLLLAECEDNQSELARRCNTKASYISQIINGWKGKAVGPRLARNLERGMGKEAGWMDRRHLQIAEPGKDYTPEIGAQEIALARRIKRLPVDMQRAVIDMIGALESALGKQAVNKRRRRK